MAACPPSFRIPLDAIVEFADPHIRYGLRFQTAEHAPEPETAPQGAFPKLVPVDSVKAETSTELPPAEEKDSEPAQVVSLDAFRRRSPDA